MGTDHYNYKYYYSSSMASFTSSRTSVAWIRWLTRMWLSSSGQLSDEARTNNAFAEITEFTYFTLDLCQLGFSCYLGITVNPQT